MASLAVLFASIRQELFHSLKIKTALLFTKCNNLEQVISL